MACTVRELQDWLSHIPDEVEVGIDDGGLSLYTVDDPTMAHGPGCAKWQTDAAECTCWKTAYIEVGGLPLE